MNLGLADSFMGIFGYKRMKPIFVGIGATSRSGKDTLANILVNLCGDKKIRAAKMSLAEPLKNELKYLTTNYFNIDPFTENDEEKNIIRPILISTGGAHRKQTHGTYFTEKLEQKALNSGMDLVIVPDIRYAQYKYDEHYWIKEKMDGFLIHLDRILDNGDKLVSSIPDEIENAPKIAEEAHLRITWDKDSKEKVAREVFEEIKKFFKIG